MKNIFAVLFALACASLASGQASVTRNGLIVQQASLQFTTPVLGVATATSLNGMVVTTTTGTLTLTNAKVFTVSNTLTLTGTDGSTLAIGTGGTLGTAAYVTLGANVGTALAIAVGSAGGPVTNGGALGTPSSGTATNLSGTAASLTAGATTNGVTAASTYGTDNIVLRADGTGRGSQGSAVTIDDTGNATFGAAGAANVTANVITSNNQTTGTMNVTTVNATNVTIAGGATNGQVLIGSTATGNMTAGVITGTNVTVTNGAGSIALSLPTSGVSAGSYTNTNLTVDATGRITVASSGSAGGSNNAALFTSTADAANDHVASDTSVIGTGVGSKTTSANYFGAGTVLVIDVTGYISTALTPDTLNVKIKAGSTTVGATGAITATGSLSNAVWRVLAIVTCRTAGASGTFIVNTIFEATGASLVAAIEGKILNTSTVTLDTTGTLVWDVTAVWGSTTAGDVITGTNALIYSPGNGAVIDPGGNGFMDRTALNTTAARTLTGTANQIAVTNGGGGGNPVFSLVSSAVLPGSPTVATAGTAAGSVVTIDGTQTLTSKTLTAAALGSSTATTQSAGDNSTKVATTAYADAAAKAGMVGTYATPDTTGGAVTLTLAVTEVWTNTTTTYTIPAVASSTGKAIIFYVVGTNAITIDPNASEIIVRDGTAQTGGVTMTLTGTAGNYVCLVCDGTRWVTLGFKGVLAAGS